MIASVRGRVVEVTGDSAVLEVGGVGVRVHCPPGVLADLRTGEEAALATSLVVREDSLTLYGFAEQDARELFEQLQTASGVGPRLAQAVLAVHPPAVVRRAVAAGELGVLTQVPGIGRKGAERMVLELRDRLGPAPDPAGAAETGGSASAGAHAAWRDQVRTGLVGLGWTAAQADRAVSAVAESLDGEVPPVPQLLKQAIRYLGKT